MITRIGLVPVWVSDQDAALEFYIGKLGFEKVSDSGEQDGYRWVEVAPIGAETGIALVQPYPETLRMAGRKPEELIGMTSFTFDTNDISATYKTFSERGVTFTEKPTMQPWGRLQAQFVDQDGNQFILQERIDIRA